MDILLGVGLLLIGMGLLHPVLVTLYELYRARLDSSSSRVITAAFAGAVSGAIMLTIRPVVLLRVAEYQANRLTIELVLARVFGAGSGVALAAMALAVIGALIGTDGAGIVILLLGAIGLRLCQGNGRLYGRALAGIGGLWVGAGLIVAGIQDLGSVSLTVIELIAIGLIVAGVSKSRLPAMTLAFAAMTTGSQLPSEAAWLLVGAELGLSVWAVIDAWRTTGVLRAVWMVQLIRCLLVALAFTTGILIGTTTTLFETCISYGAVQLSLFAAGLLWVPLAARASLWSNPATMPVDTVLQGAPEAALILARTAILIETRALFTLLGKGLALNPHDISPDSLDRTHGNLRQMQKDIEAISTHPGSRQQALQLDLLLALDHLESVRQRAMQHDRIAAARTAPSLVEKGRKLGRLLRDFPANGRLDLHAERCDALRHEMNEFRLRHRAEQIDKVVAGAEGPAALALTLDSARWMQRMSDHIWQATSLLQHQGTNSNPHLMHIR